MHIPVANQHDHRREGIKVLFRLTMLWCTYPFSKFACVIKRYPAILHQKQKKDFTVPKQYKVSFCLDISWYPLLVSRTSQLATATRRGWSLIVALYLGLVETVKPIFRCSIQFLNVLRRVMFSITTNIKHGFLFYQLNSRWNQYLRLPPKFIPLNDHLV